MDRFILVLLLLSAALAGCGRQELPVKLHVHDAFLERETKIILEEIEHVNRSLGRELYGDDVIVYTGTVSDDDGFTLEDYGDDRHVIYRLPEAPDFLYDEAMKRGYTDLNGYGTLEDVLVFADPAFEDGWTRQTRREFRHLLLHELGHFLGMMHSDDSVSVMYRGGLEIEPATEYSDGDKRNFCIIYDCAIRPP